MKANFIMPEFLADKNNNFLLMDLMKRRPEAVQQNSSIYGFYGNFPGCIWNGGRYIAGFPQSQRSKVQEIFDLYNNCYNVPLRLTFTNPCIDDEKYCYDTYANMIAECGHNGMNEILVVSPILEEYLRKNYPNYKYCRSIIAAKDIAYNTENYHMSVVNRNWVNDFEKLNSIPVEQRDRIEIICNDVCIDDCPRTYEHYKAIGQSILNFNLSPQANCTMTDKVDKDFPILELNNSKRYVHPWLITHSYLPKGFKYFKLCGRENPLKRKLNWTKYIFKPEYQEDILSKIIRQD